MRQRGRASRSQCWAVRLRVPLDAEDECPRPASRSPRETVEARCPADHEALAELVDAPGDGGTCVTCVASPAARRGERAVGEHDLVVGPVEADPITRLCSSWPTTSGRCWTSVPPHATLMSCMPRQMPSTGMSPLDRGRAPARSRPRRAAGTRVDRQRVGVVAVGGRVDVRAAREHQPVDRGPVRQPGRSTSAASGGIITASAPARCSAVM